MNQEQGKIEQITFLYQKDGGVVWQVIADVPVGLADKEARQHAMAMPIAKHLDYPRSGESTHHLVHDFSHPAFRELDWELVFDLTSVVREGDKIVELCVGTKKRS